MKVTNKTRYDSRVLRSIFLAVVADVASVRAKDPVRDEPFSHWPEKWAATRESLIRDHCAIRYVYTRAGGYSGSASLRGTRTTLRIQRERASVVDLIWLVRHEVYHLFAYNHGDMPDAVNHRSPSAFAGVRERYASLIARIGETIVEAPLKPKATQTLDEKRSAKLASIDERIARWESKARRAENALKKLRKQRRYYESALAAKGTSS